MTKEFKDKIEFYILKCQNVLEDNEKLLTEPQGIAKRLQEDIISAFNQFIPGITDNLEVKKLLPGGLNGFAVSQPNYLVNIERLKGKLEMLLATDGKYKISEDNEKDNSRNPSIIVNANSNVSGSGNSTNANTNNNTNTNTVDIKAELSRVREEIEADEVLDDDSKAEIQEKINEIEAVIDEDPNNNEKWKKLKGIITWVTTKGYKIGEKILPVLLKAIFPDA